MLPVNLDAEKVSAADKENGKCMLLIEPAHTHTGRVGN